MLRPEPVSLADVDTMAGVRRDTYPSEKDRQVPSPNKSLVMRFPESSRNGRIKARRRARSLVDLQAPEAGAMW